MQHLGLEWGAGLLPRDFILLRIKVHPTENVIFIKQCLIVRVSDDVNYKMIFSSLRVLRLPPLLGYLTLSGPIINLFVSRNTQKRKSESGKGLKEAKKGKKSEILVEILC